MEKKIYQTPQTEQLYIEMMSHLLNWSAPEDTGTGEDDKACSKKLVFDDDLDFLDDEDIEVCLSFNVWED